MSLPLAHIMVDLETLGTVPGCVGFSIGACHFHPETQTIGGEFYRIVNVDSSLDAYLREEEATVKWWAGQPDEARTVLDAAREGRGMGLEQALIDFNAWLSLCGEPKGIRLYGNGADFDNPILRVMYDAAGVTFYGDEGKGFFGGRCYRTLKSLDELFGPEFRAPKLQRQGTHHNALDDAKSQAMHLMQIVAGIKGFINYGGGGER